MFVSNARPTTSDNNYGSKATKMICPLFTIPENMTMVQQGYIGFFATMVNDLNIMTK